MARYLPCLNPNCKSHGKPHPNCRCYSGGGEDYAEGGEVSGFCSEAREHGHDCEYFAEGGDVAPAFEDTVPAFEDTAPAFEDTVDPSHNPSNNQNEKAAPPSEDVGHLRQIGAAVEGAAQGLAGPLAPIVETNMSKLGPFGLVANAFYGPITKEDINKRASDFPLTHGLSEAVAFIGSMFTGTGEAALLAKGAEAAAKVAHLGKVGSNLVKLFVEGAGFSGASSLTKSFLGAPGGDPEHPYSAAALSGMMGGVLTAGIGAPLGIVGGISGSAATKAASKEVAESTAEALARIGESFTPIQQAGKEINTALTSLPKPLQALINWKKDMFKAGVVDPAVLGYESVRSALRPLIGKILGKAENKVNDLVADAAIKAMAANKASQLPNACHYAAKIGRGLEAMSNGMSEIMGNGTNMISEPVKEPVKNLLKSRIESGAINDDIQFLINSASGSSEPEAPSESEPQFASGGQVQVPQTNQDDSSFADVLPEQHMLLTNAKIRVLNYLNSIRPLPNQPKAPFDEEPDQKQQEKIYNDAIELAVNPVGILNHINQGSLTPQTMKHFHIMYPDVHNFLSNEMGKRIAEAQVKKQKPPFAKRQAMSLFLGKDLDSCFTPQALMAIQATFAPKQQPQQGAGKKGKITQKGADKLSKGTSAYLTDEQARERRMQNQKA